MNHTSVTPDSIRAGGLVRQVFIDKPMILTLEMASLLPRRQGNSGSLVFCGVHRRSSVFIQAVRRRRGLQKCVLMWTESLSLSNMRWLS